MFMSDEPKPTRQTALETATKLTCGDRNDSYGPPFDNLSDCASLWTSYLNTKYRMRPLELDAEDVAWMMSLVKMTRSFQQGFHFDNYVDSAAYSAIAGECREMLEDRDEVSSTKAKRTYATSARSSTV